jgi:hypothetical protein
MSLAAQGQRKKMNCEKNESTENTKRKKAKG